MGRVDRVDGERVSAVCCTAMWGYFMFWSNTTKTPHDDVGLDFSDV